MNKEALIIGYAGHAYVVLDVMKANGYAAIYYCEHAHKEYNPYSLNYLGNERDDDGAVLRNGRPVFIGIGDNGVRAKVHAFLREKQSNTPSISHPSAIISPTTVIAEATVVMPGAIINAVSNIGAGVICNSACVIEHECSIGNYAHIAPGAVIAGNVTIGDLAFIGANAVIKQGIFIGKGAVVGAGATVVTNVPENAVVYGSPAKPR
jgi:acetyltransferase EpsM